MSRKMLQFVTGGLALLTVVLAGMQTFFGVRSPVYTDLPPIPVLDSNLRFFGGMGLGLGLILFGILPRIERNGTLFRAVWLCAFLGGLGRLLSWAQVGSPSTPLIVFTWIEVLGVPPLILWQRRVARDAGPVSSLD